MADESTEMSTSRLVLWGAVGVVLVLAIAAYFRSGTRVPPFDSTPAAAPAPAPAPAPARPAR
ncbi:MAG: hypothetical protein AUI55_06310 [Gemmatimonadetes bacterium 13_1_40CM_2_70_7]|nr:MAG: hypothetical protein AUJ00_05150 [Gemmatimonadetes bacterium 13_1_40CM_3_70_6]OLD42539.1 MAG: hypothetical protein AUI55_06310 [Gemmatimonadetes bacterium 13_1_40CM_2_70_7]